MKQKDRRHLLPQIKNEKPENAIIISYSQYSKWRGCPRSWKLSYIDKIKISKPGIHAVFGTAIHRILQEWIEIILTQSVKAGELINFEEKFLGYLKEEYKKEVEKLGTHFSTKEELGEFYLDGIAILTWVRKNRTRFFDRDMQFVGVEIPIFVNPDPTKPNVFLTGYLDLVVRDIRTGKYTIIDIKTSTRGWSDWDKRNETKVSQVILYKYYLSKVFSIPIDDIDVQYFIVKRKIDENSEFPQRRVQIFIPPQKSVSINRTMKSFKEFIDDCFVPEGYNLDNPYHPIAGEKYKNCRFCEFNNENHCPVQYRIVL